MPSRSPARGGRVVWETENTTPSMTDVILFSIVVLPVPDGAEIMKRLPRCINFAIPQPELPAAPMPEQSAGLLFQAAPRKGQRDYCLK